MSTFRGGQAKLGNLLESLLKRSGLKHKLKQHQIMLAWKEIVGAANARNSWPLRISGGVLWVGCSSASWAQTMTMLREQIMQKIAGMFGYCPVSEIRFASGRKPLEADGEADERPLPPKTIMLSTEQLAWIRQMTGELSDPALQSKAAAAMGSLLRQRKWHEEQGKKVCPACGRLHKSAGEVCAYCQK